MTKHSQIYRAISWVSFVQTMASVGSSWLVGFVQRARALHNLGLKDVLCASEDPHNSMGMEAPVSGEWRAGWSLSQVHLWVWRYVHTCHAPELNGWLPPFSPPLPDLLRQHIQAGSPESPVRLLLWECWDQVDRRGLSSLNGTIIGLLMMNYSMPQLFRVFAASDKEEGHRMRDVLEMPWATSPRYRG